MSPHAFGEITRIFSPRKSSTLTGPAKSLERGPDGPGCTEKSKVSAPQLRVRRELLMPAIRQCQNRVKLRLGKAELLGDEALVLGLHRRIVGWLLELGQRGGASNLPRADQIREVSFALINVKLLRQDVSLIEAREHRLVVLPTVVAPIISLRQQRLRDTLVVLDQIE